MGLNKYIFCINSPVGVNAKLEQLYKSISFLSKITAFKVLN